MKSQNSINIVNRPGFGRFPSVRGFDWGRVPSLVGGWAAFLIFLFFLMASVIFPVIPALGAILFTFLLFKSRRVAVAGVLLVVFLFFSWMNGDKLISGDWAWYTYHNMLLREMSFLDYLGSKIGVIRVKTTEPVYHFISFVTARLSNGNSTVLAWVVTGVVYLQLGVALAIMYGRAARSNVQIVTSIFVALLVGVTFTLTTQLVRQEVATAFLVLGWAFWVNGWRYSAGLWVLLGLLSHNSSIAPFVTVLASAVFCIDGGRIRYGRLFPLSIVFVALGYVFIRFSGEGGYYTVGKSDGSVSVFVYFFDFLIFSAFVWLRRSVPELAHFSAVIVATWLLYVAFLLGTYVEPLPFLRMYFYIESLRMLMLGLIVVAAFRGRVLFWFIGPLIVLSIAYVEARLITSPFWYKGGVIGHLLRPFAFFY